ncbi:MAG TPA: hypothetical protein VD866_06025, partial [Urbifossiella sp.]|nr:hypothetical protein [Urbifossiella sp.]
ERALQQVPSDGWVLHLDADTVLPGRFRHELDRAHLDPAKLYGCDRFVVRGWDRWQRLLRSGWLLNPYSGHPHVAGAPAGYELGVRWAGQDGYVPIGFFQLWHRLGGAEEWRGARVKPYATGHGKACRTDVQFGLQWDRRDRVLIPELFVGHLESDDAVTGVNWKGRQSARFGPGVRESARRGVS